MMVSRKYCPSMVVDFVLIVNTLLFPGKGKNQLCDSKVGILISEIDSKRPMTFQGAAGTSFAFDPRYKRKFSESRNFEATLAEESTESGRVKEGSTAGERCGLTLIPSMRTSISASTLLGSASTTPHAATAP